MASLHVLLNSTLKGYIYFKNILLLYLTYSL